MPLPPQGSIPTSQIEQDLEAEIAAFDKAAAGRGQKAPMAKAAPAMDSELELPPELIEALSMTLVDLGLMTASTQSVTPELRQALQAIADQAAPGLYDLNSDKDLQEVIQGVMNGTLQPSGAVSAAPGAGSTDGTGVKSVGGNTARGVPAPTGSVPAPGVAGGAGAAY